MRPDDLRHLVEQVKTLIERAVAPVERRVKLLVSRAVVKLVDDSLKYQQLQLQLLADEVQDGVEHFQPYGLTWVPPKGAEALFLSVGGARNGGVAILAGNRELRPKSLAEGEIALYTRDGLRLYAKADKSLELTADALRIGSSDASKGAARKGDSVKVTIPANTFVISVTGGSGAPAVGVPNPAPIDVTGTVTSGSGKVSVSD